MATHHEIKEHKPGSMDISEQERTFAGFLRMATWVISLAILVLIFLALSNA